MPDDLRVHATLHTGADPLAYQGWLVTTATLEGRAAAFGDRYRLSPRERSILLLVASGVELKGVGDHLGCEYSSVRTHLRRMAQKLGCRTTREVVIRLFSEEIG